MSGNPKQQVASTPFVDPRYWSFSITGWVDHPLAWSLQELTALPTVAFTLPLVCAAPTPLQQLPPQRHWRGIHLRRLLSQISMREQARYARFWAADGYAAVLPLNALAGCFLAFDADERTLTPEEGAPARLLIPGLAGYKQVKWVERLELIDHPSGGFWETRGWSLEGQLPTVITVTSDGTRHPANVAPSLHGSALSAYPIRDIALSIDHRDWMPSTVTIHSAPSDTWTKVSWSSEWQPPSSDSVSLRVRLTDANGEQHYHTQQLRFAEG